jgi:hypothetical protein
MPQRQINSIIHYFFQLPLNTTINNNNNTKNLSFDQLLQQQSMASNLNNYNNTILASLAGNLIQPQQQQQQQHRNEMTASNNIWSKLLTDTSSSLVDINQSNILHQMQQIQHTNTLYGAKTHENRGVFCRLNKLTRTQQQLNESIVVAATTTVTNDNC